MRSLHREILSSPLPTHPRDWGLLYHPMPRQIGVSPIRTFQQELRWRHQETHPQGEPASVLGCIHRLLIIRPHDRHTLFHCCTTVQANIRDRKVPDLRTPWVPLIHRRAPVHRITRSLTSRRCTHLKGSILRALRMSSLVGLPSTLQANKSCTLLTYMLLLRLCLPFNPSTNAISFPLLRHIMDIVLLSILPPSLLLLSILSIRMLCMFLSAVSRI